MSEKEVPQPRTARGRFSNRDRPEGDVELVLGDRHPAVVPSDVDASRTESDDAAHMELDERNTSMTNNTFHIDDACVVLPDPVWVSIQLTRAAATDPDYIARLTDRLYEWLGASGRVGTVLDDRDCLGLFNEIIEFESPDFDSVPVPVYCAEQTALRYRDIYGVSIVKISDGHYLIEMDHWAQL